MENVTSIQDFKELKEWKKRNELRKKNEINIGNVTIKKYEEILDVDPRIIWEMKEKLRNQPKEDRKIIGYKTDIYDDSLIPIFE